MKRYLTVSLVVIVALVMAGCEACNGGLGNEAKIIAEPILEHAAEVCGKDKNGIRGGTENIMLMTDREDDGILTCQDGTNHYFDK